MKGFMKVCGIIVAVALIIGVALLAIGGLNAGLPKLIEQIKNGDFSFGPEDFGWNSEWTVYNLGDGDMFNTAYEKIENTDSYEITYPSTEISSLEMNLGGCEVNLGISSDDTYYIKVKEVGTFQSYIENGTLYLNGINDETGLFGKNTHMQLELLVPADATFTDIKAELGAGSFEIEMLQADTIDIELGAGQLTAKNLKVAQFACEIGAGQAIVENADITGNATISVGAGELKLKGNILGDLDAECGMGNILITVLGSTEKDHNYDLDCAAGSLKAGSYTISGLAGEKSINNDASSTYKLECALGNLTVNFEE